MRFLEELLLTWEESVLFAVIFLKMRKWFFITDIDVLVSLDCHYITQLSSLVPFYCMQSVRIVLDLDCDWFAENQMVGSALRCTSPFRQMYVCWCSIPSSPVFRSHSAREMTCKAPKTAICGVGSTLSEYELYYNYARTKHPGRYVGGKDITPCHYHSRSHCMRRGIPSFSLILLVFTFCNHSHLIGTLILSYLLCSVILAMISL